MKNYIPLFVVRIKNLKNLKYQTFPQNISLFYYLLQVPGRRWKIFQEEESIEILKNFSTKAELLIFKFTLPLAKLDMVGSRFVLNDLIFWDNILVDIQLVTFFCYLILGN